MTQIEGRVRGFLASHLAASGEQLRPETRVNHDLGVAGDDGAELIERFNREFDVESASFPAIDFFGPEGGASLITLFPGGFIVSRLIGIPLHDLLAPKVLAPLTVADFVEAARRKRWGESLGRCALRGMRVPNWAPGLAALCNVFFWATVIAILVLAAT